jgi:transposase
MRGNLGLFVGAADRARLAAIVADRNRPQKHVWRARVVRLSADRLGTVEIMRRTGLSKPSVWRWQARYIEAGVEGVLRDKTRPSRVPPLDQGKVAEVIRRTLEEPPPGEATHWTVRAMARASGVSPAKVHQIWQAAGPGAASTAALQAVQRSGVRGQGRGRGRPLHGPAQARDRPVDRRKIADPSPGPHPAGPADEAGQGRHPGDNAARCPQGPPPQPCSDLQKILDTTSPRSTSYALAEA